LHTCNWFYISESDFPRICETAEIEYRATEGRPLAYSEQELAHIRLVLRKLTARRIGNPEDAEDVVQETLLTMVSKAPGIEIEKGMLIWAMGILRKKVGNYYRRARRASMLDREVRTTCGGFPSPSPESCLRHRELCTIIHGALSKFPPAERFAIDLYLEGKQTGEIARLMRPERYQNIVNRLHRGRKKLARELSRRGYSRIMQT
jgi:RNA polymerase sigma factor (sigma-70 family)